MSNALTLDKQTFVVLRDMITSRLGIVLDDSKHHLVENRLRGQVVASGSASFAAYVDKVNADGSGRMLSDLLDRVTTNHTFFMREPAHFDHFRDTSLPAAAEVAQADQSRDLRVWCAACSTGQEAYTLGMIIADSLRNKPGWKGGLLATDVSSRALDQARAGAYSADEAETIPENWRRLYGTTTADGWSVGQALKSQVVFRRLNLLRSAYPFTKPFQVIFCRNVMIYFDQPTRLAILRRFHAHMIPGGYLYLSHSESLPRDAVGFRSAGASVYQAVPL